MCRHVPCRARQGQHVSEQSQIHNRLCTAQLHSWTPQLLYRTQQHSISKHIEAHGLRVHPTLRRMSTTQPQSLRGLPTLSNTAQMALPCPGARSRRGVRKARIPRVMSHNQYTETYTARPWHSWPGLQHSTAQGHLLSKQPHTQCTEQRAVPCINGPPTMWCSPAWWQSSNPCP
jgi:hypothetical protein